MSYRDSHYPGRGRGPGFDPDRDTQWTRNSAALLHYIDGGEVEFLVQNTGTWTNFYELPTLRKFHLFPARIALSDAK